MMYSIVSHLSQAWLVYSRELTLAKETLVIKLLWVLQVQCMGIKWCKKVNSAKLGIACNTIYLHQEYTIKLTNTLYK